MIDLKYQAHVGNVGWQPEVGDGNIAGTVGQGLPLEAFRLTAYDVPGLGIYAQAYVQDDKWLNPVIQGEDVGTTGEAKHIEAVKLWLFGDEAPNYTIWYRLHVQDIGFLPWVRGGEVNGTVGGGKQAEAIQIILVSNNELFWAAQDTQTPFFDLTPQPPVVNKVETALNHMRSWVGYLAAEDNVFGVENYCIKLVSGCVRNSGIDFPDTAWCQDAVDWAIANGRWTGTPQPGFPVAFDWDGNGVANHFGMVESVNGDGSINTIEGNTSGVNGIGVYRKTRYPSEGIMGYINIG